MQRNELTMKQGLNVWGMSEKASEHNKTQRNAMQHNATVLFRRAGEIDLAKMKKVYSAVRFLR